jgi:signal transduction histidine kinase
MLDADADQTDSLSQMLLPDGHVIECVAASEVIGRGAPDLIFCNASAGCNAVRALKAMPGLARVPVILLGQQDDRLAGLEAGADDCLDMASDPVEVRLRVRNLLRLTRAACLHGGAGIAPRAVDPAAMALALTSAREQERIMLARELHDELGQQMALLKIDLHHLRAFLQGADAMLAWHGVDGEVSTLTAKIRAIAASLRPAALDEIGLEAALRTLLQRQFAHAGAQCIFEYAGLPARLEPGIDIALYRIVQECVTNIVRHACATRVVVEINGGARGDELELIVRDNGGGFDAGITHGGSGLRGIEERIQLLGGLFFLESSAQRGTRITVHLPLKRPRQMKQP